ncbi:MAG: uncharacterized protein QOH65_997 [Methylobacteriaceae bacterium]|nr:uncharacterized protein [Methylobacteriaceae bacterium]
MPRLSCALAFRSFLAGALTLICLAVAPGRAQEPLETLEIVTSDGTHGFTVEVMRTPEQLAKGLMFRRYMPDDRGMLFDFKAEQPVQFWMKNTYLPLDMIFISRAGKIVSIRENAEPLSENLIPSGAPVVAVLEVNAGTAARIHARRGDMVRASIFPK